MAGPLLIPGISAGVEVAYNVYRGFKADRALKELQKQRMPRYMDAAGPLQQNYAMSQRQAQMGLSPQATALARGTAANQMAGQFRAATDLGGGQLGSALGRIGAMNTNQLGLQLGVQDQMARERGMQQMMGVNRELSGLQQRDVSQDLNMRLEKERGYGLAKQQAIQSGLGALSGFGQAALYNTIYGPEPEPTVQTQQEETGPGGLAPTDTMVNQYMKRNPTGGVGGNFNYPKSLGSAATNVPDNIGSGELISGYEPSGLPQEFTKFNMNPRKYNRGFMNQYDMVRLPGSLEPSYRPR
jgi:hypothetical protein